MRETITLEQIQDYQAIVQTEGVEGAKRVYAELQDKGYAYAGWAGGVAGENSTAGSAAIDYMNNVSQKKTGHDVPDAVKNKIKIDMALAYLNVLERYAEREKFTNKDIDYRDVEKIHYDTFEDNGLDKDYWTLTIPFNILRDRFTNQINEEKLGATRLGRQVGVRNNMDEIQAEQERAAAAEQLAEARYGYIQAWLQLLQISGELHRDRGIATVKSFFVE